MKQKLQQKKKTKLPSIAYGDFVEFPFQFEQFEKNFKTKIISITKYVGIGIFIWLLGTILLDIGLRMNINVWILSTINFIGFGVLKYVLTDRMKVFGGSK